MPARERSNELAKLTNAERVSRAMKGPALSYLDLESLIIDAEAAVKLFAFVYGHTIRDNARVDCRAEHDGVTIVMDAEDYTALVTAEDMLEQAMQTLVDAHDHACRIDDHRKPRPVEEQVP